MFPLFVKNNLGQLLSVSQLDLFFKKWYNESWLDRFVTSKSLPSVYRVTESQGGHVKVQTSYVRGQKCL